MKKSHPSLDLETWGVTDPSVLGSGVCFQQESSLWKQKQGAWIFIPRPIYLLMNYAYIMQTPYMWQAL